MTSCNIFEDIKVSRWFHGGFTLVSRWFHVGSDKTPFLYTNLKKKLGTILPVLNSIVLFRTCVWKDVGQRTHRKAGKGFRSDLFVCITKQGFAKTAASSRGKAVAGLIN